MMRARIMALALLLLLTACAGQQGATPAGAPTAQASAIPSQPAAELSDVQVELRAFSGRRNPVWQLESEDAAELHILLGQLPEGPPATIEDRLGYGGFSATATAADGGTITLRIYDSAVIAEQNNAIRYLVDGDRKLERFLLETGKTRIDPALYQTIEDALN